ncbi:hypothetical protein DXX93_07810 [Thalassotalea euphylliae]|uniref:DUF1460 domain-containing protein n=1 Tax=Thalassotalea euphylliae TaxID=1655234 RepID=A0A3E0TPS3_9GAMM|nr:hypothetical protein [Thalassotalea euphylliae]REL26498.1 hypothetical protein DXX93_07810 [Thalassotalea euphylliae]
MNIRIHYCRLAILLLAQCIVAGQVGAQDCALTSKPTDYPALQVFQAESLRVAQQTCQSIAQDPVRAFSDKTFLMGGDADKPIKELLAQFAQHFPVDLFRDADKALASWRQYSVPEQIQEDSLNLSMAYTSGKILGFRTNKGQQINQIRTRDLAPAMTNHCQTMGFSDCRVMFTEFNRLGGVQNSYIKEWRSNRTLENIYQTADRWQQFSAESRYQTPIDIWFTSIIYRDQLKNLEKLPEPPDYQLFFARPSIVIDHFDKARKGDKTEYSLSVEWLGFNRWQSTIPWGASITSVYSDRKDGQSVGHGLMLHIYNNFSIGVVDRGNGDKSVFVSLELMDWFGQAQQKYQAYKKRYFN